MSTLFRYKFTDGEIDQLAKIYLSGKSILSINQAYGFTKRSRVVEKALHRQSIDVRLGRRKIPLSKEPEIVEGYKSGLSIYALSAKYGIVISAIATLLERNNCDRSNRSLNDEQESNLIQAYTNGKGIYQLSDMFNITPSGAHRILKRHKVITRTSGHNSRQYHINEKTFDNLNNEHAAYWLGFIYAEGSISRGTLYVALSTTDLLHLGKLRLFLEYGATIETYQVKTSTGKITSACRLCVHSKVISKRLLSLGIIKKRRWFNQLLLEQLPKSMYRHFIRGLVDGDGSLDTSKRNNARLRIYEQKDILTWIARTFESELGIPFREPRQNPGIFSLEYSGGAQARKAITWLYQDAQISLDRKIDRMTWFK